MVIAICDDDTLFTEQLSSYLKQFFKRNNLTCPDFLIFDSGESLLANTDKKDIVFLDIEMPGLSGIATGQELKKQNSKIIIFIVTIVRTKSKTGKCTEFSRLFYSYYPKRYYFRQRTEPRSTILGLILICSLCSGSSRQRINTFAAVSPISAAG